MPGSCTIVADFIPFSFMCHSTFVSAVDSVSLLPVEYQVLFRVLGSADFAWLTDCLRIWIAFACISDSPVYWIVVAGCSARVDSIAGKLAGGYQIMSIVFSLDWTKNSATYMYVSSVSNVSKHPWISKRNFGNFPKAAFSNEY